MGRPRDACLPQPPAVGDPWEGNAGVHTGTAARSAAKPRNADRERARGRLGAPTSRSAQPAGGGRKGQPHPSGWFASRRVPRGHGGAQARERRPPGRHSPPEAGGRDNPTHRDGSRLGACPAGTAARRRGNADLQVGTARRRRAEGTTPPIGMVRVSARPPRARRRAGEGTPTSRSAQPAGGGRKMRSGFPGWPFRPCSPS